MKNSQHAHLWKTTFIFCMDFGLNCVHINKIHYMKTFYGSILQSLKKKTRKNVNLALLFFNGFLKA